MSNQKSYIVEEETIQWPLVCLPVDVKYLTISITLLMLSILPLVSPC